MADARAALDAILRRCDAGQLSPPMALMEMLIETEDGDVVAAILRASAAASPRARAISELMESNAPGCARVVEMLRSGVDVPPKNATVEEGIAFARRLFDWSVRQSEEASVALYSLGNPALLHAATREIVALLDAWGALGRDKRALDIGCGIGRMEEALAPRLFDIHAIDVSGEMIAVAKRRCAGLANVVLSTCSGRDLRAFDDACFDLVFAVDSFPYLVQSGMPLVDAHVAEAARVLRPGGDLVILNFSYRDDLDADRRDVAALARAHDLAVHVSGATPFTLWSGAAFRLRRELTAREGPSP